VDALHRDLGHCFFNLLTVSPFTSLLGTNLLAADAALTPTAALRVLSLLAAGANVIVGIGLLQLSAPGYARPRTRS
jgi:hypothetical protein